MYCGLALRLRIYENTWEKGFDRRKVGGSQLLVDLESRQMLSSGVKGKQDSSVLIPCSFFIWMGIYNALESSVLC